MTVAENIKKYLDSNGIKQNVIAEKAGMRADSFCSALNGKRKISVDEYVKICTALSKPIGTFIDTLEQ